MVASLRSTLAAMAQDLWRARSNLGEILESNVSRTSLDSRRNAVTQVVKQHSPPIGEAPLKDRQRDTVACGVALGDRIPAEVLDGDPRLLADIVEADVQLGTLIRREALVTPSHDQTARRVPDAHMSHDEHRAVAVRLDQ